MPADGRWDLTGRLKGCMDTSVLTAYCWLWCFHRVSSGVLLRCVHIDCNLSAVCSLEQFCKLYHWCNIVTVQRIITFVDLQMNICHFLAVIHKK